MPLATLGAPLEDVLQRWFEVYPAIKNLLDLAYSVFASGRDRLWLHLEFLAWMQAIGRAAARTPKPCSTGRPIEEAASNIAGTNERACIAASR